ncbi:hypothetical protein [Streptomyces sp. NPDC058412]|uniref:hypothetical protein n=1 Tax=Streptomyces sp. NPDC058412 TaxID=3346486 RepID=UPI00364F2B5D
MNSRRNATLPLGLEQQERAVWQRRALGADRARLLLTNPLEGRENDVLKPRFDATSDVAVNEMALERIRYQAAGNFSYQAQNYADVEGYLLPLGRVRDSALHSWGVASGLRVTATAGSAGVKVSTGSALDAAGRVIVLADGGRAVVDQDVADRTVKVSADGLTLDTGGLTLPGDQVLTLTWQEVMGIFDAMGGSQQQGWLLAPWLRLLPLSGFEDTGQQVVLAQLTFGSGGKVKTLSPGLRRAVGVPVERLEFRRPSGSNSATLKVEDAPAADLRARADGGLDVNVPSADGTGAPALSVEGGTGTLKVQSGLQIEGGSWDKHGLRLTSSSSGNGSGLRLESSASDARSYVTYAGSDGRWHFADRNADRDRLLIDATGNVAIGSASPRCALHVEGTEVHSGGASGGFSFADRTASSGAFVENPTAGERWRWYAQGGQARLWSGTDQISVGKGGNGDALDVRRRMRVRQGSDISAGIWFRQASANTDHGFVGMASDTLVGFYGTGGAEFGLVMDTFTGNVRLGKALSLSPRCALHVEGTEVHSGGASGGFSFADRTASSGTFVESPTAGERWRWYAQGGQARLWSGTDQISVGKGGDGDALDVPRRMRVRQGNDSSAGIWFRQASANTDRAFVGMETDSTVGLYGNGGAGWGMVMDTASGNVRLGKAAAFTAQRALHVEGTEVHSGGASGGFSFADRSASSGAFVENPTGGERWRWYAQGGQARLWSGTDQISVGKGGNGDALDVPRRMRVRQGGDPSAGIWFRQASVNTDRAFVGMETDSTVGLYGTGGAGWGLVMNTVNGKVGMGTTNPQNGRLDVRVGQGGTAVAAVGKVDVEGYPGYPSIDVRGQIEIEARPGYAGLTIEQKQAYNAADIHGTLQVTGYEGYSAIYVDGNVRVIGTITGRAQMVTIDHPEDPANRYLSHTAVTSPEMTTFYNGTIVTDDQGEATVELPGYFEKLNGDRRQDGEFRYQLTPVGCLAVAIVVDEIEDNRFTIRTDKPNVKVSWQVTGIRQDAWANANRMAAELDKPEGERGLRRSAEAPAQPKGDATPQEPESNISSPGTER